MNAFESFVAEGCRKTTGQLERFWFDNRRLIIFCFFVSIMAFGIGIFNVSLSIDEELHSFVHGPEILWITQDRWAMYLLNAVISPGAVLPYLPFTIGIIANVATTVLLLKYIWNVPSEGGRYLAAPFLLVFPTIAFVFEFNSSQYGFYTGLFVGILALKVFLDGKKYSMPLSLAMLIFALSVYQAIFSAVVVSYLIYLLTSRYSPGSPSSEINLKQNILKFGLWMILGVVCHKISAYLFRSAIDIKGGYDLVDHVYSWGFLSDYNFTTVYKFISHYLFGKQWILGIHSELLFIVCVLIILGIVAKRSKDIASAFSGFFLLIAAILAPFLLIIATGNAWPTRTLMGLPILFAGLVLMALQVRSYFLKSLVVVLVVFSSYQYVLTNNRLFYAEFISWKDDVYLANRILDRIYLLEKANEANVQKPLVIVGMHQSKVSPVLIFPNEFGNTFGASIFSWDWGNSYRVVALFNYLGADMVKGPSKSEQARGVELAKRMDNWPSPGSVQVMDNLIVVKFGNPTYGQKITLGLK